MKGFAMGTLPNILFVLCIVIVAGCLVMMLYCLVMMLRNAAAYRYRMGLIGLVSAASRDDIINGRLYAWRYNTFNAVKYEEMTSKPWRPLSSFYPDMRFTRVGATDPKLAP